MVDFIGSLILALVQVFLFGGFLIFGLKYLEWYNDRELAKKAARLASKQEFITAEIILIEDENLAASQMQSFFKEIYEIGGSQTPEEIYSKGPGIQNVAFEIIGHDGSINYFITVAKNNFDTVVGSLRKHYPKIDIQECVHPFKTWPKEWWDQDGLDGSKNYHGTEIALAKDDLYPLKNWEKFTQSSDEPAVDPIDLLSETMSSMPSDGYLIMQYILRPYPIAQTNRLKGWEVEVQKLKKQFIENNVVEKSGSEVQVITVQEDEILKNLQVKIKTTQHFKTKLRWLLIYNKRTELVNEAEVKNQITAYFEALSTEFQSFADLPDTNTGLKRKASKTEGPLDFFFGGWITARTQPRGEKLYRMKRLYNSIINQDMGMGDDTSEFYLDPGSFASLFHFPQKNLESINKEKPLNMNQFVNYQIPMQFVDGRTMMMPGYQPTFYMQPSDGNQMNMQPPNFDGSLPPNPGFMLNKDEIKHIPPEDLPM